MSFAKKPGESKDTQRLRAEYLKKAQEFRGTGDSATRAKLKDEKQKMFQRVVEQVTHERREHLAGVQAALRSQGRYKSDEQLAEARAALRK